MKQNWPPPPLSCSYVIALYTCHLFNNPPPSPFERDVIYANPVNLVFVWVPVTRDKVVKVQEALPNRLIKQQQEVDKLEYILGLIQ